jgi:hypothetical protein
MIFSPGIYEHAAALISRTPWEVSRSADMMVEAHRPNFNSATFRIFKALHPIGTSEWL